MKGSNNYAIIKIGEDEYMKEIYNTDIWKELEKNDCFSSKYNEIIRQFMFYNDEDKLNLFIDDNKLIITFRSKVFNRDNNCQYIRETKYEMFLDKNSNLVINELTGVLRSKYGYDINNSTGGVLDTHYSCEVYDPNGVELAFQAYSDTYEVNEKDFGIYKIGFLPVVLGSANPNLVLFSNSLGTFLHPSIIGDNPRYIRKIRSKNDLGIVISSKCIFDKLGNILDSKEEYYFNTFISNQSLIHPERISYISEYPFATVDENNAMQFSELYTNSGLTENNYKEVANERFLKELQTEKELNTSEEILNKYDIMIKMLENRNNKFKSY